MVTQEQKKGARGHQMELEHSEQISSFAHVLQNSFYTNAVTLEPQYKCTVTQTWIAQTKSHFPWISPPLFQSLLHG